jgi:hypothetical protein
MPAGKPFHVQQSEQIEFYRQARKETGQQREPRASVSRSIFASMRAVIGKSYAGEPDELAGADPAGTASPLEARFPPSIPVIGGNRDGCPHKFAPPHFAIRHTLPGHPYVLARWPLLLHNQACTQLRTSTRAGTHCAM